MDAMIGIGITVLAVVVAALMVTLVGRAAGRRAGVVAALVVGVMMIAEYALASNGVLREWTRRPRSWRLDRRDHAAWSSRGT